MTDRELAEIREKIACPQFGDDHYGEWGALPFRHRRAIYRLWEKAYAQELAIKALMEAIDKAITEARAEAVTEFVERLEPLKKFRSCMGTSEYELCVTMREVDAVKKKWWVRRSD